MDERLEKALEFSNYMVTLNNQRAIIQQQFQENLIYYFNGGKFTVTRELLAFVQSLILATNNTSVIIDDNNIPIEISNLDTFCINIHEIYSSASNNYLSEYNNIKKNRSVEGLINLWDKECFYLHTIIQR